MIHAVVLSGIWAEGCASVATIHIRAVVVTAYEPDVGPVPGEFRYWREREKLDRELPFAYGLGSLWLNDAGVLGAVTGVGAARAAAAVIALGLDPRFDLTQAYWIVSGVCGIDPARGSLASVVLPEYVVDGDFAHEIDAREIPAGWADGFVPIGKTAPYQQPREDRFGGGDGIVFRLNPDLVGWAYEVARDVELMDTEAMSARRVQFEPGAAHAEPSVLRGDELASTTFWHGRRMSARARAWVAYQTEGMGEYAITAMEDAGLLQSLTLLAGAGRVDFGRVLVVRAASNFDQQRVGIGAAESLAETKVVAYSAYRPALENAWRVGSRVVERLLEKNPLH
jgi:purine nucleoside permease